jgi:hypothetical protein
MISTADISHFMKVLQIIRIDLFKENDLRNRFESTSPFNFRMREGFDRFTWFNRFFNFDFQRFPFLLKYYCRWIIHMDAKEEWFKYPKPIYDSREVFIYDLNWHFYDCILEMFSIVTQCECSKVSFFQGKFKAKCTLWVFT